MKNKSLLNCFRNYLSFLGHFIAFALLLFSWHITFAHGSGSLLKSVFYQEINIPAIPSGLTVMVGNTQAALNWDSTPGISYIVKRAAVPGGPYTTIQVATTDNFYINNGLTNGTTYYYVVSATNAAVESTNSAEVSAQPQAQLKISCIGDSITAGAGVADPATQSYPVQLGNLLGNGYTVANFGHSGATLLVNGDTPYWSQAEYVNAINSSPDVVVIMLGTNDSKSWNWGPYSTQFPTDYESKIDIFRNLATHPKIFIALPSKAFSEAYGISENNLIYGVRPYVIQVANEKGVSVIDVYDATMNASANFPDGIHPNVTGSGQVAAKVRDLILMPQPHVTVNGFTLTAPAGYAYQWFKNGIKIQDAVSQTLVASATGTYTVLVKINQANEDRVISDEAVITNGSGFPPANPSLLAATAGNTQAGLTWQAVANATSYNVLRGSSVNGPFTSVQTGVTAASFTNTGLQNGVTYYYVVTAANLNGESSYSNVAVATPYNGNATINTANTYVIASKSYTNKVLDIVNSSVDNGARVQINDWSNVNNKKWKFEATPDGYYRIYNVLSLKSLDIVDASTANNAPIQQWDYFASANQKWKVEDAGNGYVRIYSAGTNKLLDAGATGANGQVIFQNDGSGSDTQLWRLDLNTLDTATLIKNKGGYVVYPSPAQSFITIENTSSNNISGIKIYNITGALVYSKTGISQPKTTIDVSQLANGVYTLIMGDAAIPQKIVIAN